MGVTGTLGFPSKMYLKVPLAGDIEMLASCNFYKDSFLCLTAYWINCKILLEASNFNEWPSVNGSSKYIIPWRLYM